eukprot:7972091-Alexandrium_andersonii.AAC.1
MPGSTVSAMSLDAALAAPSVPDNGAEAAIWEGDFEVDVPSQNDAGGADFAFVVLQARPSSYKVVPMGIMSGGRLGSRYVAIAPVTLRPGEANRLFASSKPSAQIQLLSEETQSLEDCFEKAQVYERGADLLYRFSGLSLAPFGSFASAHECASAINHVISSMMALCAIPSTEHRYTTTEDDRCTDLLRVLHSHKLVTLVRDGASFHWCLSMEGLRR